MPLALSDGIICGPHRKLLAVRDHLRSNLGIICGLGTICGRGTLYRTVWNNFRQTGINSFYGGFNPFIFYFV